eukprot:403367_1
MALTGKVAPYKIGFGPFPGSVYHVPYPSDLHGISTQDSLDAIERLFKSDIEAKQVAAIIFEPVQGAALSIAIAVIGYNKSCTIAKPGIKAKDEHIA